ncbi:MAG TPA: PilZ domain-containing protein [Polyangia bacterium]|jgi:hypothetical protein
MKRAQRPAVSQSSPAPAVAAAPPRAPAIREQRRHLRFDQMFTVSLESPQHGHMRYIARNVSAGGMFLESREPLPLGCTVRVHFAMPDSDGEIVATGEVKNHYFLNFADASGARAITGMGIRFVGFEADGAESLQTGLRRFRVLH